MSKKVVRFIATKYKDKPVTVRFYTKDGAKVSFSAKETTPVKEIVRFKVKKK
ncbi:MAG: hypothetical protein ABII24_01280 [bacterium]